ncbi:hypothetical protein Pla110_21110 [Polystyrenella longa]|uniref:SLA1 homology domain-containing protein n=1 Tax=Polystyrenella longa TaxID=2528007 RepID=A0A518CMD2_9PLAN|nr:hypothetical protein [Polystyrenella longa]QDU80382.1 hypothetical protein Pla110_21110 [Polystyrenella longa]
MTFFDSTCCGTSKRYLAACLLFVFVGCNEYHAVDDVGYPTAWYVTVQLEDGTIKTIMQEELKDFASETPTAKGVIGLDRRDGKEVVIPLDQALKLDPSNTLIITRHQNLQDPESP